MEYPKWTLIDWDGNPDLHLKCWRKSFGRGHVSIMANDTEQMLIVYSYGANSDASLSSTRWRENGKHLTEDEAKAMVDANGGKYRY